MADRQPSPTECDLRIVVDHDGSTTRVGVWGELDLLSAPRFIDALDAVCAEQPAVVQVDLRSVSFLDSHGAAPLRRARQLLAGRGTLVVLGADGLQQLVLAHAGVGTSSPAP